MKTNIALFNRAGRWLRAGLRAAVSGAVLLLFTTPGSGVERQALHGHVPAAVAALQPAGRLAATNRLVLAIGLPLRHREELASLLERVCDPASPEYGHYLTPDQFAERFGPAEQDYQALIAFANTNGLTVTSLHSNRTLLDVSGSVADIERAFQVTMRVYRHPGEARTFYAPEAEPSLDLAVPVLHISGLDNYIVPRPMSLRPGPLGSPSGARPAAGTAPGGTYMGKDFRAAYVPGVTNLTGAGQLVGLLEFDGYYLADITNYASQAGLPNVPLKTVLLDGFNGTPGSGNVEVALDIDMAISMAPGLSAVVVYEGLLPDSILNRMATDNLAKQLSASWYYSVDATTEQIFQQFAAQGQSFFNASGDYDAWVADYSPPIPPCDDPYITIVGGTTLTMTTNAGSWVSETVWNWDVEYGSAYDGIGSGGGISITYPIPAYQQGLSMSANHGSTTMRNVPDVAMVADYVYVISDNGSAEWVGGTSAASPLWAGFIALVNQQAVASGRATVGFINPAIYAIGQGANYANSFHDITTGNNAWSYSAGLFPAVARYDLCTGWGTPRGAGLINALAPSSPLQITPGTGFAAGGPPGGPFNGGSQSYSLANVGPNALNWTLATTASWLSAFPTNGTLSVGAATNVTVSLNAASSNLAVGTYAASVWFTNQNDTNAQSRQVTLVVFTPPLITSQPTNQTVLGGATATFSVAATGWLPLFYQWQDNGTNLSDGGNIYGSASSTLTISNVAPANAGTYSVIVSNITGLTTSSNALLEIIRSAPVITLQPANQNLLFGATAQFTVAALGTPPLSYQWLDNGTNLTDGGNTSGSATSSLTISNVSAANIGTYSVFINNPRGSLFSADAALTVALAQPGVQLVQNGGFETGSFSSWAGSANFSDSLVGGSAAGIHSGAYGALLGPAGSLGYLSQTLPTSPGVTYLLSLWLDSPDGLSPNEFLVAWNGTTLFDQTNIPAIGWTNLQFFVTAAGTNTVLQFGFRDDQSFLGLDDISVAPLLSAGDSPPVIVTQPPSQPVAMAGSNVTLSVVAGGRLPLSYQWQFNGTNVADATTATLALTGLTTNQSGNYSVVVTNALGATTSSNALLTVLVGSPTLITFDDLAGTDLSVPVGYNSLTWTNFAYLNALTYGQPSGYIAGMISASNVAFNSYGTPAAITNVTPFDLLSAYLTAAWNDNLRVEVQGYNGATLIYNSTYTLSATNPTLINFNYLGVTTVEFISAGGTPHPGYGGSGEQFVMDNVSVLFPPSPPVITTQPASQIVTVGASATFTVTATGPPPVNYFWSRNGVFIAGATASNYTTNNVQLSDSGSQFSCLVSNTYGTTLSSNAVLTVISPPGSSVLAQGNLVVTITNYGGRISSVRFKGIELYRVGTYISDWGLQTGANAATFVRNEANTGTIGQPMLLVTSNANSASYTGTYTAGGANVVVNRNYTLVPGFDVLATTQTFTNNGASNITLRCFDTFDPDWLYNGVYYYYMYAHRYTLSVGGTSIQVGRGILTNDNTTILLGTTDATAVLAASSTSYFGIQTSANLNSFFATDGADSGGAVVDDSLDIGRELIIPPGGGASFVFYQSIASNVTTAELSLEQAAIGGAPTITAQPASQIVTVGASVTFTVTAFGSSPLSYFWSRNSAPIAGATGSSYTNNNVQLSDSGSQFSCLVSNAYGTALSSNAVLTVVPPSLVQNGGFELGSFADWTTSGNFESSFVTSLAPYVHSGVYGAEFGPSGTLGYISQTIPTTVGQMYLVSCWLYCDGETPNEFSVSWNGATLFDQQNIGSTLWTNLQFQASATDSNTVLTFGFRDDPAYLGLDDVAVYPITPPEFQTVTLTNGTISFSWNAQAGVLYQVQYTTNLAQVSWTNLGDVLSTTGSSITATDAPAASTMRFYRIVLLP